MNRTAARVALWTVLTVSAAINVVTSNLIAGSIAVLAIIGLVVSYVAGRRA